jgi:hypothetical protein
LSSGAFNEPLETPTGFYDSVINDVPESSHGNDEEKDPKNMKRPEFQKLGYIKIAEKLLEGHPKGKTVEEMVFEAFVIEAKEDFERAKTSFAVELNRGAREKRLRKDPDSDTYYFPYLAKKMRSPTLKPTDILSIGGHAEGCAYIHPPVTDNTIAPSSSLDAALIS